MLRVSLDTIDFHLVEAGTDLNLQVFPVRIATCNLHGQHTRSGITARIENIRLRNFICGGGSVRDLHHQSNNRETGKGVEVSSLGECSGVGVGACGSAGTTNTGCTSSMTTTGIGNAWVESGAAVLGPLYIDAAVSSSFLHHDTQPIQHKFLKLHDNKSKRLWFLWPKKSTKIHQEILGKCGCVGGCAFFGCNRNGPRFFKPSKQDFVEGYNVAQFKINEVGVSPGYGQSILKPGQLVFDVFAYSGFTKGHYGSTSIIDKDQPNLSSGYAKNVSPGGLPCDLKDSKDLNVSGSSLHRHHEIATESFRFLQKSVHIQQRSDGHSQDPLIEKKSQTKYSVADVRAGRIGESNSLGRTTSKEATLCIPGGELHVSPGSLSDLRLSADNVHCASHLKMPSSLSLQTELPITREKQKLSISAVGEQDQEYPHSSNSKDSPPDPSGDFHRTISVGSEALSEAFYSADEDQIHAINRRATSVSPSSSQISLPAVPECDVLSRSSEGLSSLNASRSLGIQLDAKANVAKSSTPCSSRTNSSGSITGEKSSTSSNSSLASSSNTCDYRNGSHGHSQTSLLHSSGSDISVLDETNIQPKIKLRKKIRKKSIGDDFFSEGGSVSSNSFISALSSQEDIALVDLHMQLNKPITESPLLMSSYINHMTQLRCPNWDASAPCFEQERLSTGHSQAERITPAFEKISEGFTAIKMVEGLRYCPPPRSPPPLSTNTPSHPYSWDTPIFTWGEGTENGQDEMEEPGNAVLDANTTRTTIVMKLKKDIDLTISPIALESTQRFLEALTPVMEFLHPLTIVNGAHFKSVRKVVSKNTLKKDRYMYWSKLRDGKKCGTPEQTPVVSSTYQESCFQQIQGQIRIPRVNVTLLQASVVEEIISFSALDNIRDLTCVSLFSLCLDGVNLQFSSSHQSKQSVQIFMRNPKMAGKPKKTKLKFRQNVDLFSEPVYIETSEKQQEENMISVSVNKLHIQLRRLKNESSLLKDAVITAIPNHRSKVMFTFRRHDRTIEDLDDDVEEQPTLHTLITPSNGVSTLDEERMGFIMFEAGLENIAIKAVKRKGFGNHLDSNGKGETAYQTEGGKDASFQARRDSNAPVTSSGGSGATSGYTKGATRTTSAPSGGFGQKNTKTSGAEHLPSNGAGTPSGPTTAPAGMSTPFYSRKATPDGKELNDTFHSTSPSQGSNITGHSASTKNSARDESQVQGQGKMDKKDISSFVIELSTVWFNFAAPPHSPITRKIDFTRLDWNFLSTASPSINAWMNPSDRLTVTVIHFLHASESRRLGVIASLMAEALDVQSIHVAPKNKYSKLIPLSQTIQEDPSCQLCNVLRRFVLQASLKHIESNLAHQYIPKLATLRQGVVVLSRQWKSALYMPLLMEQSFKHKQNHPVYLRRSSNQFSSHARTKNENGKSFDEKSSFVHSGKESPLSNIDEEIKDVIGSLGEETEGIVSSTSSQIPPRQPLPSFPPRSSTASAILPLHRNSHESPVRKFQFPNFGNMFETLNIFKSSHHHNSEEISAALQKEHGHIPIENSRHLSTAFPIPVLGIKSGSKASGADESEKQSLMSAAEDAGFESHLPKEDFYKWMVRQQEHNQQAGQIGKHTVTFNQGLDLPILSEGSEMDYEERNDFENATFPSQQHPTNVYSEPQSAHFLEAHVIFEPLLSAIGVIAQQVTAGALEQLGANVSVAGSIEIFRMDIIESEASKLNRKKRKTGLHPGKFFLDIGSEVPSFICEKMGLDIDIRKVPDESRGWVCQQPTIFVSRSALKQHTSTMVNFSLNVSYIAQQVNMPLLRLLHQIYSMYQNARETQIGLKEQRPSKSKSTAPHPAHSKDSYSELHEGEFKGVENSLSLSEEQATLSSVGGFRGQRDSVVSSLSAARVPSPTPAASETSQPQSGLNRFGRPQSFAQKLKSSKKMSRGYRNLVLEREKGVNSPLLSRSVSGLEGATLFSDKSPLLGTSDPLPTTPPALPSTPKCWRNIYYLVDLYATTPETKTVQQRPSVAHDIAERYKQSHKFETSLKDQKNEDVEAGIITPTPQETSILTDKIKEPGYFWSERTPLVIYGLAKIQKTKLLATISGLKLEAEMNALHSSITFREKVKGLGNHTSTSEMSLIGQLGSTMIVLLEGISPNQQTVVRVAINKSQGLYSSLSRKSRNKNSALITIGPVQIDIPQHPIILHDMMTRGTKQLSSTLQELRVTRPSRLSRGTTIDEADAAPSPRPSHSKTPEPMEPFTAQDSLLHPLTIQFSILLQEMSIHAALLPSLQATYCMQQVSSDGFTGAKANFKIRLSYHHLAFSTKIQDLPMESKLPPSAKICLPQVHVEAHYIQDDAATKDINAADGMVLTEGSYLSAVAEIGSLEHSLTTDLLNHLVFVQKVFMKEVNEVVQKMAGSSDKPISLFAEEIGGMNSSSAHSSRSQGLLLFNVQIKLKGIIITATTPTQSAVRLETGFVELQLSNRVENVSKPPRTSASASHHPKIFGKAQVEITLALGQLIRNDLFDEIEPHFQQLAYFRTRIGLRNALHEELSSISEEGEMVLINLTRPLICIQPLAVDKAVLVWLNYKNAYEYWNEQRATLNKEVLTATQQVFEKVPQLSSLSSAANIKSTLFLKLTVSDIGICLPLNPCRTISHQVDSTETRDALVVTLASTIISACNSGSLVCKAQFKDFCTRFAPDFETSLDDWKPDYRDRSIMNLCKVSEGTYEVCSRTVAQNTDKGQNAKWLLNVEWQMEGVELHFDVNIGKHLSSLARTLTMLTGSPDTANPPSSTDYDSDEEDNVDHTPQGSGNLPSFIFDNHMDPRQRAKLLEIEMNEQAKIVNDLKTLGASPLTIEQEVRRLKELEQIVSNDFRRDMLMKIRRQSIKATSMKDRLGLGHKLQMRSKSFRVPSPTVELKEPTRHWSIASGSTDSNIPLDDDIGDVFVSSPTEKSMTSRSRIPVSPMPSLDVDEDMSYQNKSGDKYESGLSDAFKKKVFSPQSSYGISGPQINGTPSQPIFKPQDPSIDLVLDVKVCINSGECILYNEDFSKKKDKDKEKEKEEEPKGKMKKERSYSGGLYDLSLSPSSFRKRADLKNFTATKLKHLNQAITSAGVEVNGFSIPGLDVEVHYESHNIHGDTPLSVGKEVPEHESCWPQTSEGDFPQSSVFQSAHKSSLTTSRSYSPPGSPSAEYNKTRTSSPYQSPSIENPADEGGMGPNKPTAFSPLFSGGPQRKGHTKKASLFTWLTLQTIPEETVIRPSILDFMEKVLEPIPLPEPAKHEMTSPISTEPEMVFNEDIDSCLSGGPSSGGYPYASFPVDVIVYFHMKPSTIRFSSQPVLRVECLLKLPSLNVVFSSKRAEESDMSALNDSSTMKGLMGGLNVTGTLEDFSLFVFHPYGSKNTSSSAIPCNPLNETERKDFLSVVVEFVKFHISRSRKINFIKQEAQPKSFKCSQQTSDASKAIVRFSTIVDIGTALFKYDMRHITEILAFPRAWYRRTLVRRLFLGDMTSRSKSNYESNEAAPSEANNFYHATKRHSVSSGNVNGENSRWNNTVNQSINSQGTSPPSHSNSAGSKDHSWKRDKSRMSSDAEQTQFSPKISGSSNSANERSESWETLVLFAVNFTKLNVHMNMRNVMGHAVLTTKAFNANGRLSIGSSGHKNLYIGLGLSGSCLEAKGGIVGGLIELADINTYMKICEDPGTEPDHEIGLKLFASQSRLDYMGTSVLMGRVSSFGLTLKDEWRLKQCSKEYDDTTRREATIFILGDIVWDQLQLLINKSTTADLLKMHNRLQEFFAQQFNSSKLVFSSFHTDGAKIAKAKDRQMDSNRKAQNVLGMNTNPDARHHRHWQRVLKIVSGLRLSTLPFPLPTSGTELGGSFELHGKTIFLACFHGVNFKSKSWALFSLKEPYINFTSEVQEVPGEVNKDTHIVQKLIISLGVMEQAQAQHVSMAKVCRITRNMVFPPQFRTIQEWFHYAFCTSDLDDINRFPTLDSNRTDSLTSTSSANEKRSSARLQDHNHSSETIFALPSLEIHHTTKHLQTAGTPDIMDKKPVVECSLVTEFQDHIFVTIDAENFFFLHDLITSYIKDTKEKMALEGDTKEGEKPKTMKVNEPTQLLQQDWREFTCSTWHLEPTVRLLSWATRNLDPYGVDFILNKLGFSHARTTIPKWLQRGCMDPLDKVLSVLLFRMISAILEHDVANK